MFIHEGHPLRVAFVLLANELRYVKKITFFAIKDLTIFDFFYYCN